ncbi:MAG TPA: hypothetical protein VK745_20560 [Polyangiaceae bacterium]|jgi:hypothetical protein|nr:hypothetical protein [Polyangiaceae bacterium]
MPIPENFKYDMRVRERMLRRGQLTESELTKHVDALTDVADLLVEVELKQPALQRESEREARIVSRSAPRPVVAHVPAVRSLENELNDIEEDEDDDLDDDDDDDDDLKVKAAPKAEVAAEKPNGAKEEPAVAPAAPAAKEPDDEGWGSET